MLKPKTLQSKTFKLAIAGILGAGAAYFSGQIDAVTAVEVGFLALLGIFGRDSVSKVEETQEIPGE